MMLFGIHLTQFLRADIFNYDAKQLGEIRDEIKAWTLLKRHLAFSGLDKTIICKCLLVTLDSLTDVDLGQVARLPYGGHNDLFEQNQWVCK